MAALWKLDAIALNKERRSGGPESARLPSGARAQMGAVDCVSEHQTPRINHKFGASCGDTWTH